MYRARSPFVAVAISQQRLNERKEKREMSIEPNERIDKERETKEQQPPQIINPQTIDERFCFPLTAPIEEQPGVFWSYVIPSCVVNEYNRKLIFREQNYFTKGIEEEDICQTIYIVAENVPGFKDENGSITHRVCALHLQSIQSVIDDTGTKTYDLLYQQLQDYAWEIPMNVSELKFKILFDEVPRTTPLNIPVNCQFDIRHVGK